VIRTLIRWLRPHPPRPDGTADREQQQRQVLADEFRRRIERRDQEHRRLLGEVTSPSSLSTALEQIRTERRR